ncbi:MAG: hypothetical protein ACYTJ0_09255 [Planctomycetota bacterium]|jgi:hypothetical protein
MPSLRFLALLVTSCVLAAGCTSYSKVTDPASGEEYYTTQVHRMDGGAVRFKDDRTGTEMTLQSSQIMNITAEQYNAAVGKK